MATPEGAPGRSFGRTLVVAATSLATHLSIWFLVLILAPTAILISPIRDGDVAFRLVKIWTYFIFKVSGVKLVVSGLENVSGAEPQVIVSNHEGNFDIYALCSVLDIRYRFLIKRELFMIPLFGWALWTLDFPGVDRFNPERAKKGIGGATEMIRRRRMSIAGFPEGTRNTGPELLPFKKGLFLLAIDLGLPIVPVAIHGSRNVQARHGFFINPGTIRLNFLEPVPTTGLTHGDRDRLIEEIRSKIRARLSG